MKRIICKIMVFGSMSFVCIPPALGHEPVKRVPDVEVGAARIFAADSENGNIIAINLPDGKISKILSAPKYTLSMALSTDEQHLFVMRGRNTDRDFITVIDTGIDKKNKILKTPYIARTIQASSPAPGEDNRVFRFGEQDMLFMEGSGEMLVFENNNFSSFDAVKQKRYKMVGPDHYHFVELNSKAYIGHLMRGLVQVRSMETGEEVAQIKGCPVLHGMIENKDTGHIFLNCKNNVMVVGSKGEEENKVLRSVNYSPNTRLGAYMRGKNGVVWGFTEGIRTHLYKLDTASPLANYAIIPLEIESAIRHISTENGEFLLSLTLSGKLQVLHGETGQLLKSIPISSPFGGKFDEDLTKALLPSLEIYAGKVYVSLPHEGRIVEVNLDEGRLQRFFATGGQPTRMVIGNVL